MRGVGCPEPQNQLLAENIMNVATLKAIGVDIATFVAHYSGGPNREMLIDPAFYAWLRASGRPVQRQYPAHLPNAIRSPRIDFCVKPPNAVLIEFAVRPPIGGGQLYGSQNQPELRKLCRFSNAQAKLRALVLIDLSSHPIERPALKATYDSLNAGRGNFPRHPVQVIYAHASGAYSFLWNPYSQTSG
jgi:hypothetical protein